MPQPDKPDERNKGVIFKNFVPFPNCKSDINNTETHNAKDIDSNTNV